MPLLRTVTLQRTGRINVRVAGNTHCGADSATADGVVRVQYTIHLVVGPNDLDDRLFLVDQEALHQVMVNIGMDPVAWHEPCEFLAVLWSERVLRWISTTNTRCTVHEFTLNLSPDPHLGNFTATYTTQPRAELSAVAMRA